MLINVNQLDAMISHRQRVIQSKLLMEKTC
jgi:hypothetical protein